MQKLTYVCLVREIKGRTCVCPMDNPVIDSGREKEECQYKRANEVERVRFKIEKSVRKLITI